MAKTYRGLYPQVYSFENLYSAWRKARKGKRGRREVARFEFDLERNLFDLQARLRERSYRPGAYRSFHIHEPKRRLISAAPFRDRVVHHALCNVIEPIFDRSFIHDSYANRTGKGTHQALDRCTHFMRRHAFALQCDVLQFFPSIDHAILMRTLSRRIADRDVLRLAETILASGAGVLSAEYTMQWFPGDDMFAASRPRGLPIGNLTSQFWANVYLDRLDHFVKRELRCGAYLRYVDDFILFGDDRRELMAFRDAIYGFLETLRLRIHPGAHPRPVTEGFPFLGFVVFPTHRRLKGRKVVHFRRRLRRLREEVRDGCLEIAALNEVVRSWAEHAGHGDTYALRRSVLSSDVVHPHRPPLIVNVP